MVEDERIDSKEEEDVSVDKPEIEKVENSFETEKTGQERISSSENKIHDNDKIENNGQRAENNKEIKLPDTCDRVSF